MIRKRYFIKNFENLLLVHLVHVAQPTLLPIFLERIEQMIRSQKFQPFSEIEFYGHR